ncbi:MAG: family 78 glycoside hydrolase catalytic domain [Armatimonadetes bacterium]|nr:family 78 glycoside hydrolase catalytic domain [Armatimonadota bacterium]
MPNRAIILLCVSMLMSSACGSQSKPSAELLRTEYLANPLGIDTPEPRVAWHFVQEGRACRQTAYEIQVAETPSALGKSNVWSSGRVSSSESVNVPLQGIRLSSSTRYYWRVKVWDAAGVGSKWSDVAWFETALLEPGEWQGEWLTVPMGGNGYHSSLARSAGSAKWVQIDLGARRTIAGVSLYPARPYNWQEDAPGFGFPVRYRIEASDDPEFKTPTVLVDRTDGDQPNPKEETVKLDFPAVDARYVRLTATTLYRRFDGDFLLAFAEMDVLDGSGRTVSRSAAVSSLDSVEEHGWNRTQLTDGQLHSVKPLSSAPMFRHEFDLGKPVKRARAYVTGLGYYELHLNGQKVGDHVLDPAYTGFSKRVLYSTYDVTDMLKTGRNAVGAMLGSGWFKESPRLLLQMNVEFKDGTRTRVTTDSYWKRSEGPILENSLYHGETYDARAEQVGWDMPGFDDSGWQEVLLSTTPTHTLSAQMIQPIRVTETMKPKSVTSPREGTWVYDFGQNFSGWCRLKVSGPAGTEVTMKHAEWLYDDGTANQENLRSARATDKYILKGQGTETWEPRFTYHGFRYVQIEGFPGKPDLDTIKGRVVNTSFTAHGGFECSNPLINRIHSNSWWGYRTNWHSIPTDCPQRDERQGWMADGHMTADMGLYNFDVAPAYTKWLQDMQDAQGDDGRIPDTVPHVWGSNPGDPMWASAYHFVTWDMYRHTGDRQLLARHYDGLKRYVDMLEREAGDGHIISRNNYGDWVGVVETPRDLISTGGFYRCSWLTARMAEILGHPEDVRVYDRLCRRIAEAFHAKFFNAETNNYGNGSQYSNAWPLYLGIVPADRHDAVVQNLVNDIEVNRKGHLSTGFLGARYLLEVLCQEGHADVAYTIVTQKDYPGWGYMIANGATTVWELWVKATGNGMNSANHPAFGFVDGWFYRALAGIKPDDMVGGFERFDIKPFVVGDLNEAKAEINTVRGPVASHWKRSKDGLTLDVTIPANSHASVWVPKVGIADPEVRIGRTPVWRKGKLVPGTPGIHAASDAGGWVRFEVGSGEYSFLVGK